MSLGTLYALLSERFAKDQCVKSFYTLALKISKSVKLLYTIFFCQVCTEKITKITIAKTNAYNISM
jgi:hypothetical protein